MVAIQSSDAGLAQEQAKLLGMQILLNRLLPPEMLAGPQNKGPAADGARFLP